MSLYVDPITGGYISVNGKLLKVIATINKANLLLRQPIGKNIYAPNEGNPLIDTEGLLTRSQIASGINSCLAPLVNNGEIDNLAILNFILTPTEKYKISIGITLPNGDTVPIDWTR